MSSITSSARPRNIGIRPDEKAWAPRITRVEVDHGRIGGGPVRNLGGPIAQLEARRAELLTLIENEARSDEGTAEAEQRLRETEDEHAALRILTATLTSDPRHS